MQRRVRIKPRFWVFVIVTMLICFGASFAVAQVQYNRASARVESLSAERTALSDRIDLLSSQLAYMKTDDYVERVARDELHMIMPGEIRYVSNG